MRRVANSFTGPELAPYQKKEEPKKGFLQTMERITPVSILNTFNAPLLPAFTLPLARVAHAATQQAERLKNRFFPIETRQVQLNKRREAEKKAICARMELEESLRNEIALLAATVLQLETSFQNQKDIYEKAEAVLQQGVDTRKAAYNDLAAEEKKLLEENTKLNQQFAKVDHDIRFHACHC